MELFKNEKIKQFFQGEKIKKLFQSEKIQKIFQNEKVKKIFQSEKIQRLFHSDAFNHVVQKANISTLFKAANFLGIDISDRSIEFVETSGSGNNLAVLNKGRIVLPAGLIERGIIKDRPTLLKVVNDLFANNGIKNRSNTVFFGLPESQLYTHTFSTELHAKGEYDDIIDKEIRSIVPLDSFVPVFVSSAKKINDTKAQITTISSESSIISDWFSFFKELGFQKVFASSETLALFEGLYLKKEVFPVCVVDIGSIITNCSFFDVNGLQFSFSVNVGGDTLTKIISDTEKISIEEAEKKKNSTPLDKLDPKMVEIMKKTCFDKITSAIKEAASFCARKKELTIKSLVVVGGTSEVPGVAEHIQKYTYLDIVEPEGPFKRGTTDFLFVEAVGLARIGLKKKEDQLVISSDDFLKNEKKIRVESSGVEKEILETSQGETTKETFTGKDSSEEEAEEEDESAKAHRQLLVLGSILAIGLTVVGGSYFYTQKQNQTIKAQKVFEQKKNNMVEMQIVEIAIPVAVQADNYAQDRVKGRIIEDSITTDKTLKEAKNLSFEKINGGVAKPEILFSEPARVVSIKENTKTTYTFSWLAYDDDSIRGLVTGKIDLVLVKIKDTIPYKIDTIEKTKLATTTNPNVYMLSTKTTVLSSDPLTIVIPQ
jgi:Tfp pilus assembly PilM family ATPase